MIDDDDSPPEPLSRTQQLLKDLGHGPDFSDPDLPTGLFSYSQYRAYKTCGKAYEYKYVLRLPVPQYASTGRGSAVHRGAEHALRAKMQGLALPTIEEMRDVVGESFVENTKTVQDWGEVDPGRAKDDTIRLYEAFHTYGLAKINPLAVEKGFAKKIGDIPMVGWIDLIDQVPAIDVKGLPPQEQALAPLKRVTADLKTAAKRWSADQVDREPQLTLYAEVEGTPDVRIDLLVPLKSGPVYAQVASTRTKTDVTVLKEDMHDTVDFIKRGIFPRAPINGWVCTPKYCSFWAQCRGSK